jgi:hypothetical protein
MPKQVITLEVDYPVYDGDQDDVPGATEPPHLWAWEAFADHYHECEQYGSMTRSIKVLSYGPVEETKEADEEDEKQHHREWEA